MRSQQNTLSAAIEGPETLRAVELYERLNKAGSTWEIWSPGPGAIPNTDKISVVRAINKKTNDCFISHSEIGTSEFLLGLWIRNRIAKGCKKVPLRKDYGLTSEQIFAAKLCLENPVSALSGLPGTGKTYALRSIV